MTGVLVGSDKLVSIKLEAHIPKESPLFQKIITEVAVGSRKTTALNEVPISIVHCTSNSQRIARRKM